MPQEVFLDLRILATRRQDTPAQDMPAVVVLADQDSLGSSNGRCRGFPAYGSPMV